MGLFASVAFCGERRVGVSLPWSYGLGGRERGGVIEI
jgi:hypothetical protein